MDVRLVAVIAILLAAGLPAFSASAAPGTDEPAPTPVASKRLHTEIGPGERVTIEGIDYVLRSDIVARIAGRGFTFEPRGEGPPPGTMPVLEPLDHPGDPAQLRVLSGDVLIALHGAPIPVSWPGTSIDVLAGGFAVWHAGDALAALATARALAEAGIAATPLALRTREAKTLNDAFLGEQWHLDNVGQSGGTPGVDVEAFAAWDLATGQGVTISIVDDGVQYTHPDLASNYNGAVSRNYCDGPFMDSAPRNADDVHGTAVAGLAAARGGNSIGIAGVAPHATFAAQRLIACGVSDAAEAAALGSFLQDIDVVSNSWGPPGDVTNTEGPFAATRAAILEGVASGRAGKGVVYLWAAGNDDFVQTGPFSFASDSAAYDGYANDRHVIAVGAVGHTGESAIYSEDCACLLVSAPSNDLSGGGIVTTDRTGTAGYTDVDYTCLAGENCFGGTSAATPMVAGAVALMLEANPALTWRDVHAILAATADRTQLDAGFFATNAAGRQWSKFYGFGLVDAAAAVSAAQAWTLLRPEARLSGISTIDLPVPDGTGDFPSPGPAVTQTIEIGSDLVLERAELILNATHPWENDLYVTLTSPAGTVSEILPGRDADAGQDFETWRVSSVQFWGEHAQGTWTLTVRDLAEFDVGQVDDWKLNLFGTVRLPRFPFDANLDCILQPGEYGAARAARLQGSIPVLLYAQARAARLFAGNYATLMPSDYSCTPPAPVAIAGFQFQPPQLTIQAGDAVKWSNQDGTAHTVTADGGGFTSDVLAGGATFQHEFAAPGTFPYHCAIHPGMVGTVTVT